MAWKQQILQSLTSIKTTVDNLIEDVKDAADNFSGIEDFDPDELVTEIEGLKQLSDELYTAEEDLQVEKDNEEDDEEEEDEDEES
jgi:predicted component of type VI protein secretion system